MTLHRLVLLAAAGCFAAACASTPEPRYYVLEPVAEALSRPALDRPLFLDAVSIPPQLDRPQMVVSRGAGEVTIDDGHRWAAPLQADITRVLARELAALASAPVQTEPAAVPPGCDRVTVRIVAMDSRLGQDASLEATWEARGAGRTLSGSTRVREPATGDYRDLVQAHSRALARLAREIASTVAALPDRSPTKEKT
jgi:uncharacterized protein